MPQPQIRELKKSQHMIVYIKGLAWIVPGEVNCDELGEKYTKVGSHPTWSGLPNASRPSMQSSMHGD